MPSVYATNQPQRFPSIEAVAVKIANDIKALSGQCSCERTMLRLWGVSGSFLKRPGYEAFREVIARLLKDLPVLFN